MRKALVQADHQCLQPVADHAEQITCPHLPVGRLQHAIEAGVVVMLGLGQLEQVTQRFFKGIFQAHLRKGDRLTSVHCRG